MKFTFKVGWKIGNVTADARLRVQQQQRKLKTQRLWRRQCERAKRRQSQSGSNAATKCDPLAQKHNRKALLIKRTCTEFIAQMELLHRQIDKPPKALPKSKKSNFQQDGSFHQAVGKGE
ncbi:unnamed protein product [Ceratitis capitata]|uniref:(Mediterranean fruit fly) hypothetical protein n=1 Tax=Ceratitis capitata TaxID=7213 RepID=A0A811UXC2_CERCA|nr:unnamed protein product [Ceratitis capitata]